MTFVRDPSEFGLGRRFLAIYREKRQPQPAWIATEAGATLVPHVGGYLPRRVAARIAWRLAREAAK